MNVRALVLVAACALAPLSAAQLPELLWTCPMHGDVLENRPGACPICVMALEPVRLTRIFTCPVHSVVQQTTPGLCRICKRDLGPATASLTFTCPESGERRLEPYTCADRTPASARYTLRAHGDHNPKHGGIFFMAADNWHHLEGAYPAAGRFRVYVYDDYSRPLPATDVRRIRGRVVTKEVFDSATGKWRELASAPLVPARNGAFLEARVRGVALPAKLTAKVAMRPGETEHRFDFAFDHYSRALPAASPAPIAQSTSSAPAVTPDNLLERLKARQAEVAAHIEQGSLSAIFVPALDAKDAALALQERSDLPPSIDRDAVESSVKAIVVAAYDLDASGDRGDGVKTREAYERLSTAIAALERIARLRRP